MSSYGYWMRRRCREVKLQWVDDKKNMNKADWLWQHTSPEEYYFSRRVCVRHMYIISCHETNMGESVAILLLAIRVFRWGVFLYFQKVVHIEIYAAARLYVRRIFFFLLVHFIGSSVIPVARVLAATNAICLHVCVWECRLFVARIAQGKVLQTILRPIHRRLPRHV